MSNPMADLARKEMAHCKRVWSVGDAKGKTALRDHSIRVTPPLHERIERFCGKGMSVEELAGITGQTIKRIYTEMSAHGLKL